MTNHRLRVLFPTHLKTDHHLADSIFETVKRPNHPNAAFWKNPSNPQHQECFVSLFDGEKGSLLVTTASTNMRFYQIATPLPSLSYVLLVRWGLGLLPNT